MKAALIDVGSNTIKMAVYEYENGAWKTVWYHAEYAYLIGCIEGGCLTDSGIQKAGKLIGDFVNRAVQMKCSFIRCFSTASLRYIENQSEVISTVKQMAGITIEPISGEQEAYYNFLGMQQVIPEKNFLGGDLGGGSAQLFCCQEQQLVWQDSFPIGALKLKEELVSGEFPTKEEYRLIQRHVSGILEQAKLQSPSAIVRIDWMGGTMRLISSLLGKQEGSSILYTQLEQLAQRYLTDHAQMKQEVEAIQPERMNTILPGLAILCAVGAYFGCRECSYRQTSVRDGFLQEWIQK